MTSPLYHPCLNRLCDAKVSGLSQYCCLPCVTASEGNYEIDKHSDSCVERQAARKGTQ